MLDPLAVRQFYDRFGPRQDRQGFYEDAALESLTEHADFPAAHDVVEFGCGTGRFAERVLAGAAGPRYVGFDVSSTMTALAGRRLARFGDRARVELVEPDTVVLPLREGAADRVVSTYVLDLLAEDRIRGFFDEAARLLRPGGRLCLVSIAPGSGVWPRAVSGLWTAAFRWRPALVGGCRPIRLAAYCDPARWAVTSHERVVAWGVTSEVLVATRPG
jgi:ubiquinone/menaquinone biosynthesis C-methylase UbiE